MTQHRWGRLLALLFVGMIAGCAGSSGSFSLGPATSGDAHASVPLFEGMGTHHRKVTTSSGQAQRYFDQGLIWAFAFNHDEAIRSFRRAATLDPDCAMAWWGISLCNGPHINNMAVPPERSKAAWAALQRALALRTRAAPVERDLITALSHRYADPPPEDRKPLEEAYATAMREVWLTYPEDADVGVLFAEAMMDLRPWDLWTSEGKPQPGTEEIVSALQDVMTLNQDHVGALHLLIHAVEASPHPEKALAAADRLRGRVPISGHLVHMPSHIYVRLGRWPDAAEANVAAIEADRRYRAVSPQQDFYRFYMAHTQHFLAWTSMMQGRSKAAFHAARQMIDDVPIEYIGVNAPAVDPFLSIELEVFMRFGKWDEILKEPVPSSALPITTAVWRFARGVALAATNKAAKAEREYDELQKAIDDVPRDATLGNNKAHDCLVIASHVLKGEIALANEEFDLAISELREAVKREDALRYNEAPDWIQPTRHALGAVLLRAGRPQQAEQVYREDLQRWPENGWALYGLTESLRARGEKAEAEKTDLRFRKAWSDADVSISASCLCALRHKVDVPTTGPTP